MIVFYKIILQYQLNTVLRSKKLWFIVLISFMIHYHRLSRQNAIFYQITELQASRQFSSSWWTVKIHPAYLLDYLSQLSPPEVSELRTPDLFGTVNQLKSSRIRSRFYQKMYCNNYIAITRLFGCHFKPMCIVNKNCYDQIPKPSAFIITENPPMY